jgi:hypothetical protein
MTDKENINPAKKQVPLPCSLMQLFIEEIGLRNNLRLICRRQGCVYYKREQKFSLEWRCSSSSASGCKGRFTTSKDMKEVYSD